MKSGFLTLAAIGVTALLVGCGGDGNASSSTAPQGSGSLELQVGFSAAGTTEARSQVETDIAKCMKVQGFDYTPIDPVARQAALTRRSNLSDEDFTKQFGYGIATLYGRGNDRSDPNARVRRSLSKADRSAYDNALTGGKPGQTYFRAADTGDFTDLGGCTKKAADRLFGGSELLASLQQVLDELDQAVAEDQRMVRAQEAWRQCMRDRTGGSFEDSEGVELEIQKQLASIVGPLPEGESAPGEFANQTPTEPVDHAALSRLRQLEVQYAVADTKCEEEHLEAVEDTVTKEKEKEFRDRYAELLRQVKPLGTGS
jgi:hypothetical protein